MISGFNTEIKINGVIYHIQTEDKGINNPVIESLVYQGGAILASRRSSYKDHVDKEDVKKIVSKLMEVQHKEVLLKVKNNELFGERDDDTKTYILDKSESDESIEGIKSLDQVILDFLQESKAEINLDEIEFDIFITRGAKLYLKNEETIEVFVKNSESSEPINNVVVGVKIRQKNKNKSKILAKTKTDDTGKAQLKIMIPKFDVNIAEVVLFARTDYKILERVLEIAELKPAEKIILVVDKDSQNRALVKKILDTADYKVFVSPTGMDAWQVICNKIPNVLMLYEKIEVLGTSKIIDLIRKKEETRNISIIVIGSEDKEDEDIDLNEIQAYIERPFKSREILALVKHILVSQAQ